MKTKGATSHTLISLKTLNEKLAPDAQVLVSRRWVKANLEKVEQATPTAPVEEKVNIQFVN